MLERGLGARVRCAAGESGLVHRLSEGPPGAGVGIVVMTTRAGLMRLRNLAASLQAVTTLLAVIPPRPTDPTTDDAEEFVERLVGPLSGGPVHTIAGHSVASYVAARLAERFAAQQVVPPTLVLLEPPLTADLTDQPLSDFLFLPELVYQRFVERLPGGAVATAARGTPAFRAQLMHTLFAHRAEFEAVLDNVDPTILRAPPTVAFGIYAEWAGWNSLCMQLTGATYQGPSVSIEGLQTAEMPAQDRAGRFARLRESFPRIQLRETTLLHTELLSEAVLRPLFVP